jgi:hypothetical protein
METSILSVKYQILSSGPNDANLMVTLDIVKDGEAFAGFTEDEMVAFVRGYLQSLTKNPVTINKVQVIQTSGL